MGGVFKPIIKEFEYFFPLDWYQNGRENLYQAMLIVAGSKT
jgi:hypothetical protein